MKKTTKSVKMQNYQMDGEVTKVVTVKIMSGGGAKFAKSLKVEILWKKLVHKSNKRGVEGGKISEIDKRGGWIFVLRRVELFKIGKRGLHVY